MRDQWKHVLFYHWLLSDRMNDMLFGWIIYQSTVLHVPCTTKTFKIALWMRKYGALSWKRTWLWSNNAKIALLDLGQLTKGGKEGCLPTTDRYQDKSGRFRFKGNGNLKGAQYLFLIIQQVFYFYSSGHDVLYIYILGWPTWNPMLVVNPSW